MSNPAQGTIDHLTECNRRLLMTVREIVDLSERPGEFAKKLQHLGPLITLLGRELGDHEALVDRLFPKPDPE